MGRINIKQNYEDRDEYKKDLQFGDGELEIFCRKNPPERMSYSQEACGLRHFAFHVENIDDVVAELNKKRNRNGSHSSRSVHESKDNLLPRSRRTSVGNT